MNPSPYLYDGCRHYPVPPLCELMCSLCCRYVASTGCIKPLCDLLSVQDSKVVVVILEGLENILRVGSKSGVENPYAVLIEEAYGMCA